MDNEVDLLQIKIDEAKAQLSKETRSAIDDVNWKFIIEGMNKKYNPDQLENLETETELLLCGILSPGAYQEELEKRMLLSKESVILLLNDMDRLIFKKIQEKLEERISGKGITPSIDKSSALNLPSISRPINKTPIMDSRFINLPNNIQEAIANSGWKEKLYGMAQKYKINIEEMGILERITAKVMLNVIHPDKYEESITSEITISKEDVSNLVKEANENIFKKIRGLMETKNEVKTEKRDDEIPLPPYANVGIKKEELPKSPEVVSTLEQPKSFVIPKPIENTPVTNDVPKNMIEEKLQGATTSEHTVSDYSTPKTNDPYHEPIE